VILALLVFLLTTLRRLLLLLVFVRPPLCRFLLALLGGSVCLPLRLGGRRRFIPSLLSMHRDQQHRRDHERHQQNELSKDAFHRSLPDS
jgi:hypothetical protein